MTSSNFLNNSFLGINGRKDTQTYNNLRNRDCSLGAGQTQT